MYLDLNDILLRGEPIVNVGLMLRGSQCVGTKSKAVLKLNVIQILIEIFHLDSKWISH